MSDEAGVAEEMLREALRQLYKKVDDVCTCPLHAGRTHPVEESYRYRESVRQLSRLRKAVTWLKGALHDESPFHEGPHETCRTWECIRARVVLVETSALLGPDSGPDEVGKAD